MHFNNYLNIILTIVFLIATFGCNNEKADHYTYASLFWKKDSLQVREIKSNKADLFQKLGHHGPAKPAKQLTTYLTTNISLDDELNSKASLEDFVNNTKPL